MESRKVFWGEIAPSEHLVEIYEDDAKLLSSLEEFVCAGFDSGDGVIVIATGAHLEGLETRLKNRGFSIGIMKSRGQYIAADAEEILKRFMVNDWPDEELFKSTITEIISAARQDGRRVRAFGEMVAVMWSKGLTGATVRLEHLWNKLSHSNPFYLYCAYPKAGFTQKPEASLREICAAHSHMIATDANGVRLRMAVKKIDTSYPTVA